LWGINRLGIADPTGEADKGTLTPDFDRRLMIQFRGSVITSMPDSWRIANWMTPSAEVSPIIRPPSGTNSCPGIGSIAKPQPLPPDNHPSPPWPDAYAEFDLALLE